MADFTLEVDVILLQFNLQHEWNFFGKKVIYDTYPIGVREQISRDTSGLDLEAKAVVTSVLELAYSIRSIDGYDFGGQLNGKLKFVRAMPNPVFELFTEELRAARIAQLEMFKSKQDELKKSTPNQS